MLNKKKFIVLVIIILLMCGCMNKVNEKENLEKEESYIFSYNGIDIELGSIFSTEKYGKEDEYSEIESCAFDGLDKTYRYSNYEITTYPDGNKDRIYSIYFLDDSVKTKEGIKINDTLEDMVNMYGNNYEKLDNLYIYHKNNTNIRFIIENNIIISIEYQYKIK